MPSNVRARGAALLVSAAAVLAALVIALARAGARSWAEATGPGPADPGTVLTGLSAFGGALVAAWLLAGLVASCAYALLPSPTRSGGVLERAVRGCAGVTPAAVRHGVAALLGVSLLAGPAAVAHAAEPRPVAAAAPLAGLSPAWAAPSTPGAAAPRSGLSPAWAPAAPTRTGGTVAPPTNDAVRPGRGPAPATGWLPAAPEPSRVRATVPDLGLVGSDRLRASARIDGDVVVRSGDSLWSIAARHLGPGAGDAEVASEWPHWFTANRAVIGPDPDHLAPGLRLVPPPAHRLAQAHR